MEAMFNVWLHKKLSIRKLLERRKGEWSEGNAEIVKDKGDVWGTVGNVHDPSLAMTFCLVADLMHLSCWSVSITAQQARPVCNTASTSHMS